MTISQEVVLGKRGARVPIRPGFAVLLVGALCATHPAGALAAEDCVEPKDSAVFSREWAMSKLVDAKEYVIDQSGDAAKNLAFSAAKSVLTGGSFEEIAKVAIGAALNSYVPGLSGMLGLTGGGPDPMAIYTQQILDRIDSAEQNIKDEIDRFWDEIRESDNIEINASFQTIKSDLRRWETEYTQWGQLALPGALSDTVTDMGHFIEEASLQIARPGSPTDGYKPYPYLHHLETISQVIQLQLLHEPKFAYIVAARGMGVSDYPTYQSATPETFEKINSMARPTALAALENPLNHAFALAKKLSDLDVFKQRVNWMFGATSMTYDGGCWSDAVKSRVAAHGMTLPSVGLEEFNPMSYKIRREKAPGSVSTTDHKYCIVAAIKPGSWVPTYFSDYDGMVRGFTTREEAFRAHRQGMHNMLLRVGWGPYRVLLDRWWSILKNHGLRSGDRPYLALDQQLDAYLVDGPSAPLASLLSILQGNSTPSTMAAARRSKFVAYGIEYGDVALLTVPWAAGASDPLAPIGEYPLAVHEHFLSLKNRAPSRAEKFYAGQFAAKFATH